MPLGIYLDNSTVSRPSNATVSKMLPFFTDYWGTPSAPHHKGQELFPAIEESYRAIYALLGAKDADDFVLTSSGSEAVNQAIFSGYYDVTLPSGKNHFLTTLIDQAASIMAIHRLEKMGTVSKLLPVSPQGYLEAKTLADFVTPRTAMLSLSAANGLTGVIQPMNEISDICKERGIRLHIDASHILGKLYFELDDLGADLISFNGAQLHAPKNTGGLYIKNGTKVGPLIAGGVEQAGRRAGDLDVPSLIGLATAAKEAMECRDLVCTEVARLRNKFEQEIVSALPDAVIFFRTSERLPHCTAIAFPGIANEALLYALNRKHVYASIGGGTFQQIALLLEASGVDHALAHSALSFSLSRETNEAEIENAIEIIVDTVKKMKKTSMPIIIRND